jgi:hypothetical protein
LLTIRPKASSDHNMVQLRAARSYFKTPIQCIPPPKSHFSDNRRLKPEDKGDCTFYGELPGLPFGGAGPIPNATAETEVGGAIVPALTARAGTRLDHWQRAVKRRQGSQEMVCASKLCWPHISGFSA